MKNILAFDTSTIFIHAAVMKEGKLTSFSSNTGLTHSEHLLKILDFLLHQSALVLRDIDLIVCSRGPGSFTGLRIALSTAKGLSLGASIPLVTVPVLDTLFSDFSWYPETVIPVMDARKKRVYSAVYKNSENITGFLDISLVNLFNMIKDFNSCLICGPDAGMLSDFIIDEKGKTFWDEKKYVMTDSYINTSSLIHSGIDLYNQFGGEHEDSGPLYIRRSEAEEKMLQTLNAKELNTNEKD
ncbi:MAG: tRNA (adenosine(37)-N6)-threonylcarbamoyltransferase complex dimerization subunit type 1 TsaB [Spirochaetia bacterium]|nr:tRNA (adenosine(37)-N6)-threonylcarbamoyltransferase complex dimerization subunit type 1 TsaB [Spirochaetia bacterium]